jgi:HEPN domain-containing protein
MYGELLNIFENKKNLGGKAWQHSLNIDAIEKLNIDDCSLHCFHYQQVFEMLFKYILEVKSEFGAYPHTHKLGKLLEAVISMTKFKTNKKKYYESLGYITACAEIYRYNFLLDCKVYKESIKVCDELLNELVDFVKNKKIKKDK